MRDDKRNDRLHTEPRGTIAPLGELDDFEVADGDPDVRGWDVRTTDGRTVGEVDDLIVDTALMKARYLVVHVDDDAVGTKDDRRILVPVGAARLDEDEDRVHVPFSAAILAAMPPFDAKRFDREYETALRSRYVAAGIGTGGEGKDFYAHEHFDDNRFWGRRRQGRERSAYLTRSEEELAVGKRPVRAGEVEVKKHVDTKHVERNVPVTREEATVERRPASRGARRGEPRITEDEVRVPLMAEEVVTEKRTVPKEEIVIKKHAVRDEQKVEADLRKERVDVERHGKSAAGRADEEHRKR